MVYKWNENARYSISAQIAGEVCEELESRGELTAKKLVEVSRPESAPLHKVFNWNDEEAAELYREEQGRRMIRCLVVVPENNTVTTRAYFSIVAQEPEYHSINTILESKDKYEALMETAMKELVSFKKKYAVLEKLQPVFDAIESIGA